MPVADDSDQIEERVLVLRAQQGDRIAFFKLVDLYDRRLLYFVRRILGETESAFDVLQSVWLIVYQKFRKLKSPDAFRVWLYRIAHDQAVTELRRKTKRPILVEDVSTIQGLDESSENEKVFENAELVHVALNSLSVDHRRVLTLRFLEEMTIEEIAEVVGCQSGTVKSRLHYAKSQLRCRIEELLNA